MIRVCAIILISLIALVRCQTIQPEVKSIVCLIDFSNSIDHKKILEYSVGIEMILSAMGPEDKLIVYPIDAGSLTDRVTIMFEDFRNADENYGMTFKNLNLPDSISPPFKKKGEDALTATANKPKRLNGYLNVISPLIVQRLDSLKKIRKKYGNESDIFSAIYSVKDDFTKQEQKKWMPGEKTVNYLIIFSDLVQESEIANFNSSHGLKKVDYDRIMKNLQEKSLLVNLQGAKVIVYDSYSNSKVSSSSMAKISIREFWERYFSDSTVNAFTHAMKYKNSSSMDDLPSVLRNY